MSFHSPSDLRIPPKLVLAIKSQIQEQQELINSLQDKRNPFNLKVFENYELINKFVDSLEENQVSFIIFFIKKVSDLVEPYRILKKLGKNTSPSKTQVLMLTSLSDHKLHYKLKQEGCLDIISTSLPLDNLIDQLKKHLGLAPKNFSNFPGIQKIQPLQLKSDFWFWDESIPPFCKQSIWSSFWVGPSPLTGKWINENPNSSNVATFDSPSDYEAFWLWQPTKPEKASFPTFSKDGVWKFYGLEPNFSKRTWLLQGKFPRLSFWEKQIEKAVRLSVNAAHELIIPANSEISILGLRLIEDEIEEYEEYLQKNYPEKDLEFRIQLTPFLSKKGSWVETCSTSQGKFFLYLQSLFRTGELQESSQNSSHLHSIFQWEEYWVYHGNTPPELEVLPGRGKELQVHWVFQKEKPICYQSFQELPRMIQDWLNNHYGPIKQTENSDLHAQKVFWSPQDTEFLAFSVTPEVQRQLENRLLSFAISAGEMLSLEPNQKLSYLTLEFDQKFASSLKALFGVENVELWISTEAQEDYSQWICTNSAGVHFDTILKAWTAQNKIHLLSCLYNSQSSQWGVWYALPHGGIFLVFQKLNDVFPFDLAFLEKFKSTAKLFFKNYRENRLRLSS